MFEWLKRRLRATTLADAMRAAENGDVRAQLYLGMSYHTGRDRTPDLEKAVFWYERAAKQGNATAQVALGLLYGNGGEGIRPDPIRAYAWATLAASTLAVAAKMQQELSDGMTRVQVQQATELASQLIRTDRDQSSSSEARDVLQAEYLRLLKRHGLELSSLEGPASLFQDRARDIVREIERTDHSDFPRATFRHYFPDLLGSLMQFHTNGPGFKLQLQVIS